MAKGRLNYNMIPGDVTNLEYIISDMSRILSQQLDESNPMSAYVLTNGSRKFTANQSLGSHRLTNVLDPVSNQDAATKIYVDTALSSYIPSGDALLLDQTTPQTFSNLGGGTGIMKVTAGLLGLDTSTYLTADPYWSRTGTTLSPLTVNDAMQANGGFLSTGTTDGATWPTGAGTRCMWIPSKSAFRAGKTDEITWWDYANIGIGSVGLGNTVLASGISSVAIGDDTQVNYNYGVGIGTNNAVDAVSGVTIGTQCYIGTGATEGIAIGKIAQALKQTDIAIGQEVTTNAGGGISIGRLFTNTTANSIAFGVDAIDLLLTSGLANFQDTAITTTGIITGNSLRTAQYIGIPSDTDLLELSDDELTVNGNISGDGIQGTSLALGAGSLTMTGSLGSTGSRLTKGWFTDLQTTNAPIIDTLTASRLVYVGASKELVDNANITTDGTTLTAGGLKTAGYLSLGTGVGAAATPIYADYDISASSLTGLTLNTTTTKTAAPGISNIIGLGFLSEWRPSDDMTANRTSTGALYGLYGAAKINSTDLTSGYNIAVPSAQGGYFWVAATKGASHTGTVTITNGYGVRIADAVISGTPTITTLYGLHLAQMTKGGTNWQLYSVGGDSAFGGNTRFGGVTAPTVALDVTGAGLFSSTLGVTGLITATGGLTYPTHIDNAVLFTDATGLVSSDADLTFVTDTLTVTKLVIGTSLTTVGGTAPAADGTYALPTSITIKSGIITAIS